MFKFYETELAGRKLSIETGKFANQANGSVTVRYGDTVDYEEKLYAVG